MNTPSLNIPSFVCASITALSAFVSLGFSYSAARTSESAAQQTARYALARSAALALVALIPFFLMSTGWLSAIALTMALVQSFDAIIGAASQDRMKTLGPAAFAVLSFLALAWLRTAGM